MAVAERTASARWRGSLLEGEGEVTADSSGLVTASPLTWGSRTEDAAGRTSPEELLAAAHASCYAMSLSSTLAKQGTPADALEVRATCGLDKTDAGLKVTTMEIAVRGSVPGIDGQGFQEAARKADEGCPISNAIRGNVEIRVDAQLI